MEPRSPNLQWQEELQAIRKRREAWENSNEFVNALFDDKTRQFPDGANLSEPWYLEATDVTLEQMHVDSVGTSTPEDGEAAPDFGTEAEAAGRPLVERAHLRRKGTQASGGRWEGAGGPANTNCFLDQCS